MTAVLKSAVLASALALSRVTAPGVAQAQDKVVYHVNDTGTQALAALRKIRNHLDTEPTTQIRVVTHAWGSRTVT